MNFPPFLFIETEGFIPVFSSSPFPAVFSSSPFPAVLVLNGGKTFGRAKGAKGRLLYQCIPNDPEYPVFLVPYDVKLDFSKVMKNKYVIMHFDCWNGAHPQGILDAVLGNVDECAPFNEYQLYCRNLVKFQDKAFAEFTKAARQHKAKSDDETWIMSHLANPEYKIVDLTGVNNIISVDPEGCEDIDDAFSVKTLDGLNQGLIQVSIYIANVPLWLSILDLWKHVHYECDTSINRITTVYLPDRKVPMLPTVLSEDLCSLKAGKLRFAFVMHATFKAQSDNCSEGTNGSNELVSVAYENAIIKVKTNYAYEDKKLLKSADYALLKQISQGLDKESCDSCDSHDVVATFMKLMNAQCAETLASMNTGIFRNQKGTEDGQTNSTEGGILSAEYSTINEGHSHLGLSHYTHITSPIRRLVDLINMRILMNGSPEDLKGETIEKINKISKSAKKAQMDCELYSKVLGADPETVYTGAIVDVDTDEFGRATHTVYLEELKTYARVKGAVGVGPPRYKVYLFDDEHNLRRKIRVECIA
jgi:exoribonuclease R